MVMNMINKEELMYNYIHDSDVYLYQRKDMFRMNTDTALLAHFMRVESNETILDIGTNNGALLCYAALSKPKMMYGVDILEEACKLADYNLKHRGVDYQIICSDIKEINLNNLDVIVCNPPYFPYDETSNSNDSIYLKTARHEVFLTLDTLCCKVSNMLKDKGRFYMVHRANRLQEIMNSLSKYGLYVKVMKLIYDENKEEAIGVLIEAYKDSGYGMKVLTPIINTR